MTKHNTGYQKPITTTKKPELIDSEMLLEAAEKFTAAQAEQKEVSRKLNIVAAALCDFVESPAVSMLKALREDYATEEEYQEQVLPAYLKVTELLESLTDRQLRIMYKFVVEQQSITRIASFYSISKPGVLKTLSLIRKKSLKIIGDSI